MTVEATIAELLDSRLAPILEAVGNLANQVELLRRLLPTELASQTEAARKLNLSLSTVKRRVKDGTLPVRRVGGTIKVDMVAARCGSTADDVSRLVRSIRAPLGSDYGKETP